MIFWCQSCGEQHTSAHVASANITVCAKCGGQSFATWQPNRQSLSLESVRSEALEKAAKALVERIVNHLSCYDGPVTSPDLVLLSEAAIALAQAQARIEELEAGRDFQSARVEQIVTEEAAAAKILKARCERAETRIKELEELLRVSLSREPREKPDDRPGKGQAPENGVDR